MATPAVYQPPSPKCETLPAKPGLPRLWRNLGAARWWWVEATSLPGDPWYDGGLPGVIVRQSDFGVLKEGRGWTQRWNQTWFVPCRDVVQFMKMCRERWLVPPTELRRRDRCHMFQLATPSHPSQQRRA